MSQVENGSFLTHHVQETAMELAYAHDEPVEEVARRIYELARELRVSLAWNIVDYLAYANDSTLWQWEHPVTLAHAAGSKS